MTMNKVYISFLAALAIMLLGSCNDFLEEDPTDRLTVDKAITSRSELFLNCVANLYRDVGGSSNAQGLQGTSHGLYDLNTFDTDEAMVPTRGADWYDGGYWQALYTHDFSQADGTGDVWNYLFRQVLACNVSLKRISDFAATHPGENVDEYIAEVRGLRAMYMFYAMDLYGRLPIFDSPTPSASQLALQPRSKVYQYIIDELLAIEPQLSIKSSCLPGEYYGRFTKPVALFLLAKLALNVEVYNDDDWTDDLRPNGSQFFFTLYGNKLNAWEAVVYICDYLSNLGFRMEDDFSTNFAVHNEVSRENIFVIPMDKLLYDSQFVNLFRSRHYNHAAALGLNGENGPCATREALMAFGLFEDQAIDAEDVDPRFALTYYCGQVYDLNGNIITLDDGTPLVYEPWKVALDVSGTPWEKTAGARMRKYEIDPTATMDGRHSDNDIVLMRMADVVLMKAEALLRNGDDGSEPFNEVRERVSAKPMECTLATVLDERQRELAWEGWRRNDLIRFGLFTRAYSDRPQLPGESNGYTTVFPIPGEFLNFTRCSQNPGW